MKKLIGSSSLLAGTCIGAATIALPVATANIGFLGALTIFIFSWSLMAFTGCLTLEAISYMPENTSFIKLTEQTFGKKASGLILLSYGGLLYSLLAAYLTGGGDILSGSLQTLISGDTIWLILGFIILALGLNYIDKVNRLFLVILLLSFIAMALWSITHINIDRLSNFNLSSHKSILIILTAFGYQVIIPSLRNYANSNYKIITKAIIFGSIIPLLIYIIWSSCVFGTIPLQGEHGLLSLQQTGKIAYYLPLWMANGVPYNSLSISINAFIFFAIATSFLGISISLYDFLKDLLPKIKNNIKFKQHLSLLLMVLIPPWIYAHFWPGGFIKALSYAGILVLLLNIILPICLVLKLRANNTPPKNHFRVKISSNFLWFFLVFSCCLFFL